MRVRGRERGRKESEKKKKKNSERDKKKVKVSHCFSIVCFLKLFSRDSQTICFLKRLRKKNREMFLRGGREGAWKRNGCFVLLSGVVSIWNGGRK